MVSRAALRSLAALTRRRLLAVFLRGERFLCPCCGGRFRRFLSFGTDRRRRRDAQCPRCGALERHRLLSIYLRERTALHRDPLRVLHLAPEPSLGRGLRALPNLRYTSADLESPAADERFDICRIPYPDDTFDVVLCSHVLEHVSDDRRAMGELHRILRPGGWGVIQVPIKGEWTFEDSTVTSERDRHRVFGQRDHVRIYGRDYYDRLREAGFAVTLDRFAEELPSERVARHRLPVGEVICICTKATETDRQAAGEESNAG